LSLDRQLRADLDQGSEWHAEKRRSFSDKIMRLVAFGACGASSGSPKPVGAVPV
jgi:hypothetical protein